MPTRSSIWGSSKVTLRPNADVRDSALSAVRCAELFDLGLMGIEIPEKFGGTGSSFTGACIVVEELARM
jgi:alkylation response protein AidB-like acyl-CoA dehydrogenase